jgi:hypothetical protein
MPKPNLLAPLERKGNAKEKNNDRRTIGRANEVAGMVENDPSLFPQLISGLWSDNPVVRMRAADAAEKVTRKNPELLQPHKTELLGLLAEATQQELRWHLAALVPRLSLTPKQRRDAILTLERYLEDLSSIVKTFALQGLAELAQRDPTALPKVIEILRLASRTGTPAMQARSRKLLLRVDK